MMLECERLKNDDCDTYTYNLSLLFLGDFNINNKYNVI